MGSIELHKIDFQKFLEAIDQCKGNVFLVTDEGDRLNLKSKLCQMRAALSARPRSYAKILMMTACCFALIFTAIKCWTKTSNA